MSYDDFNELLKQLKGVDFYKTILPIIKQGITDTLEALANILEDQTPQQDGCLTNCFEVRPNNLIHFLALRLRFHDER